MGDKAIPDGASSTTTTITPFPFFPNFRFDVPNFHFDFPNPFRQQPRRQIAASGDRTPPADGDKPDAVKFADRKPPPTNSPLHLEVDETSHPLLNYSVYALGGFIVLQWVWARWNERKERAKKRSSAEENQTPDDHSPAEGEE
ncbi:unnamed protein product [Linum trigynum]|uniref:Uncharacterized protein n=1 Tax=Linum trigynum TaxID=586398 RepID=A0AAV2ELU8_9ROSI